jgi:tetratricopeptide (TPR) repeat protein
MVEQAAGGEGAQGQDETLRRAVRVHQEGRLDAAEAMYRAILDAAPDHFDALHLLGVVRHQQARHEEALALLSAAVRHQPRSAEALQHRGLVLHALRRHEEALASYDQALAIRPDHAGGLNSRGNALQALGRFDEALASYDRALLVQPDHVEAHYNRGKALRACGRHAEALASHERALALRPRFAEAQNERGIALDALGRHDEALASYDRALALRPDDASFWNNRGNALHALGRDEEALASYDRALALEPLSCEAHDNRGIALQRLDRLPEAIESYTRALAIRPAFPEALCNRATALHRLNRLDEALAGYREAQAARPGYAEAHWYQGQALLAAGDLAAGWRKLEWRWQAGAFTSPRRSFARPAWQGRESIAGRTVLLHAEQGLGDTLQFVRYAPQVAQRGARVVLEVQEPLRALLAGIPGVERALARGEALPDFDLHCPLLSLPLAFGTTLEDVPPPPPGLVIAEERRAHWRKRLGEPTAPRVGVAWSGLADHRDDRHRSIPLEALRPLLDLPGFRFVSLQKEVRDRDREALDAAAGLLRFGEELGDFSDTAALVSLLDVVVSADTAVAHLAGSCGRPVWILLPFSPDWRWMLGREDSPWYPTARLFRQTRRGAWEPVVRRVGDALRERFAGRGDPSRSAGPDHPSL